MRAILLLTPNYHRAALTGTAIRDENDLCHGALAIEKCCAGEMSA